MMKDIRYFNDYAGEDGYIIVDSIEGEIPGGKKKLSELGVNAYEVVSAAGDDNHPDVDPRDASTKILYIVETDTEDTTYIPWIWTLGESAEYQWKQLGSKPLPDNSWKQWSDDKGSSSTSDESVYIGQSNRVERDDTYVLGKGNIVASTDNSQDYSDTDVVSIGKNNTTQDGANVYQLGRDNTVIGNNLGNKDYYPNSMAVNIGRDNIINTPNRLDRGGEGINIGKLNTAQGFGINIGQNNTAKNVSIAIGENRHADGTNALSIGFDKKSYDIDLYDVNSLKYGDDYYPIGEYTPIKLSDTGRLVKYAAFDSTTHLPVEVKRYSMVYNEETGKVTFYESTDTTTIYGYLTGTPVIAELDRANGYLDGDNIISAKSAPSGQTIRTYYRYYWYDYGNEPSESTKNSRAVICTTQTTIYIDPAKFVPNNWVAYNYNDYAQYLIPGDDVKSNVYITNERMFAGNTGRDTLCSIRITGKEVDGKFIPWFNDNFPKSECTMRDFNPNSIVTKSYYANELKEKYNFYLSPETCHKNMNEVQDGAKAIGSLINVNYGGFGIASEYNQSLWVSLTDKFVADNRTGTEYYYDNGSVKTNNYAVTCITDAKVLTPAGLLDTFRTTVNSGAFGINTGRSTGSKPGALFANGGAIAIGNNLTVDNGGIGIGVDNGKIGCGSVTIGVNNFSPNCAGTLMIANNTTYRSGYNNSKNEIYNYGSSIFGTGNYLQNTHSGATVLGNYNAVGDTIPAYGSVAMGNYNCIKGSGAISIGRGATAKYGALSISCGTGYTYPGCGCTFATDGSIALGYKGIYSQAGSLSMGYNGVFSIYGSFAIGYNGVSAFDSSFAIGHEGSYARDRSVSIGIGGVCAHNQSYAFGRAITSISNSMSIGFAGVNSYSGALAIGSSGVTSVYDSVAIGLQGVKGSNGSFAAGRGGTTAFYTSTAYGSGAFATNYSTALSINSYLTYSGSGVFKNSDFFYFNGRNYDCTGYVDVKLSGITRVYGYKTETVRGVITYVEDSSGSLYLYKTPTGKYYENLNDIPYEDYNVSIRGHINENGWVIPFLGAKADVMGDIEIPDTWVNVTWGNDTNQVQVRKSAVPTDFLTCGATNNSMILGDSSYAGYGSLAIAQSAGSDNRQFYYNRSNWSSAGEYGKIITTHAGNEFTKDGKQYLRTFRAFESIATNLSIAIGTSSRANNASLSFGYFVDADSGSMALGYGGKDKPNMYGQAKNNSLLISGLGNPTDDKNPRGSSSNKSIAIGTANTADNQSISIGDENIADRNAFAFGTKNTSYGWSIGIGVNNTTPEVNGAHATQIGYNNESTSNLEQLEKTIRVKYDKQTALNKEIERYNKVHGKYLNLIRPYLTSAEYSKIVSYEQAQYDYKVNDGPNPGYDQEYYDIKNSLLNSPEIIMTSSQWDTWYTGYNNGYYNMYYACDYYYYYTQEHDSYYWDEYVQYRDYAYPYLPSFLQVMLDYATENMPAETVALIQQAIDAIADRPETPTDEIFDLFYNYYSAFGKLVNQVFYYSYDRKDYATYGKLPSKQQYSYREYDAEITSLFLIIESIKRSGSSGIYIDEVEEVPCNTVVLGSGNLSRHYNSVLIGANNESFAPVGETAKTDDDGFMFALGYHNKVGRNYDIAIGYMSEANGGENVAIQHSTAGNGNKSYHNLAMFDSTALGTGNIALQHAEIKSGYRNLAMFDSTIDAGVLNVVHGNSKLVCTGDGNINNFVLAESTFTGTGGSGDNFIQYNSLFNSDISTSGAMYFCRFFRTNGIVESGASGASNSEYFANKDLQLIAGSADRNLLFGNISAGLRASSVCRNMFFGNDDRYGALGLNATTISDCIISTMHVLQFSTGSFTDNVLLNSRLMGNSSDFTTNVLLGRSIAELQWTEGISMPVTYNFLFNARLNLANYNCSQTVLFDCVATNVSESFAFGFGDTAERGADQGLYDSFRTVTFGDGIIRGSQDTFHFGANNEITGAHDSAIFGRGNTISGNGIGSGTSLGSLRLLGSGNTVNGNAVANAIIGNTNSIYGTSTLDYCGADNNIILGNANGIYAQYMVSGNTIIGGGNYITGVTPDVTLIDSAAELNSIDHACMVKVIHDSAVPTGESYTSIYSDSYYYYSNGTLARLYSWSSGLTEVIKATAIVMTGSSLASAFNAGTLQEFTWYYASSTQNNVSIPAGEMLWNTTSYYYDGTNVTAMESGTNGRYIFRNAIIGDANVIHNNVAGFTVLGGNNTITYTAPRKIDDCISYGLVQGNNNTANDGSNIVCLGNGNRSTGHNSVAIGDQLVSNQWQTVIGKYNSPIEGPNRLDTENPQDASKALFIIGNGYSEKDDEDWQNEDYITRSNAMVVYADGTVRAKKFVSDEPELELTAGTGITLTPDVTAGTNIVSVSQDLAGIIAFLASRPDTGRYTINSVDGVLSWVQIGTTQV